MYHQRSRNYLHFWSNSLPDRLLVGLVLLHFLLSVQCFVDHCLFFRHFSFDHYIVCTSSIYGFMLPLWYLQIFLNCFIYKTQYLHNQYRSITGWGLFHIHFRMRAILIVDDPTMTVKCRTSITTIFIYLNLCKSVMLDSMLITNESPISDNVRIV